MSGRGQSDAAGGGGIQSSGGVPDRGRGRSVGLYLVVAAATVSVAAIVGAARAPVARPHFEEIDVERINIVEADGRLRVVISNEARQHRGVRGGDTIPRSGPRPPGLLFFDQAGDEMGGLVFGANGEVGHFGSLTFDRVQGDQTIGFRHLESGDGPYSAGLELWQQPRVSLRELETRIDRLEAIEDPADRRAEIRAMRERGELSARRLFLGKGRDDVAALELFDALGRPRIRLRVPPGGDPAMEILDEAGAVVHRFPG